MIEGLEEGFEVPSWISVQIGTIHGVKILVLQDRESSRHVDVNLVGISDLRPVVAALIGAKIYAEFGDEMTKMHRRIAQATLQASQEQSPNVELSPIDRQIIKRYRELGDLETYSSVSPVTF